MLKLAHLPKWAHSFISSCLPKEIYIFFLNIYKHIRTVFKQRYAVVSSYLPSSICILKKTLGESSDNQK